MSKTQIGNVVGFSKEMFKNILYVLGVGYMGSSFSTLGKAMMLFPTDIHQAPYSGRIATNTDVDLLEYLWPMKSLGFPYTYMNTMGDSIVGGYIKWMIETCAYSFILMRTITTQLIVVGNRFAKENAVCALFRFYIMPIVFIQLLLSIGAFAIVFMCFFVTIGISMFAMERYGFMYTLSPLTGFIYGLSLCKEWSIMGIVSAFGIGIMGVMAPMIHIPWWFMVTYAVYAYSVVILLFSPFLWKNGLTHTFHEMKSYKMSLVLLFIFLTLKSSNQFLIPQVSVGLLLGSIYLMYQIIRGK